MLSLGEATQSNCPRPVILKCFLLVIMFLHFWGEAVTKWLYIPVIETEYNAH